MARKLRDAVVVITGASSGIGREAAAQFAEEGARLVLAARDGEALEEVAAICRARGVDAIGVPTDVADERSVEALRDAAVDRFGRIDVWVNDAGVYMMGSVESTPSEAYERLFETNLLGVVHGARAALGEFRKRGSGVLINVGSLAGKVAYANASAYCASQHAVHAFTESLRQELVGTDIQACLVAPGSVDTPMFQHAANFTGREITARKPVYPPERVASAIVASAKRPRRERRIGGLPVFTSLMHALLPAVYERTQPRLVEHESLGEGHRPATRGNLQRPLAPHDVHGGWKITPTSIWRAIGTLAALAVPVAVLATRGRHG
jgi:NADP-dependent 3-hydroxy acid dehydrogenase YdfG